MPAWTLYNRIRMPLLLMAIAEMSVVFSSLYVAALFVHGTIADCEAALGPLAPRAILISVVILISLIAMGLYQFHTRIYYREVIIRVIAAIIAGSFILAALFYVFPTAVVSRQMAVVSVTYALLMLLLLRYLFLRHVDENVFRRRTLVYGAGGRAAGITDLKRRADRRGFRVVGMIPAPGDTRRPDQQTIEADAKALTEIAKETRADEIVVAMDDRRGNLPIRELLDCRLNGIEVIDLLEFLERETGKIRVDLVSPGWLIFSPGFRRSRLKRVAKRVFDIVFSAAALALTWPIMLLVALAIKLEEGPRAPILYRQRRVGLDGKLFDVLKFRSMRVDAEADGKAVWAKKNDSRVTRVGDFLRKSRLDELPQGINVLLGEMSWVGPRPERPEFVEGLSKRIPYYSERHVVQPGVTGWAQLKYSYGASEDDAIEKLQFELYYVKNQNLLLDLMILLQTVEVILWGKGAR